MALTQVQGGMLAGSSNTVTTIQSNGTTAITVDASQNVGIGTTSPAYKLELKGVGTGVTSRMGITNTTTGSTLEVGSDGNGGFFATSGSYGTLFYTNGTERMRISSGGFVGIGEAPNTEAMLQIKATSSQKPQLQLVQDNATDGWNLNATSSGGWLAFQRKGSGGTNTVAYYDPSGNLVISGSTAQKASGTTWSNPSDVRLKQNITDYTKGLAELAQVNVKSWDYNGKAGTTEGSKGLGVIADEIMQVLPETVDTYEAKLNVEDEEVTDVKRFDATEITWLLVNAVKELNAKVDAQALEIAALKAAP
jgi:hypothetical protein